MSRRSTNRKLIHLNRLLSKRGILTRSHANAAILAGRVAVNGRIVRDPGKPVDESARIELDAQATRAQAWRTILFHKPRGVLTTRQDPEGRTTIYDVLGEAARGLIPVGRLDWATSGLLLLTTDTQLADRLTDPRSAIPRVYAVTVRGKVTSEGCERLERGIVDKGERMRADEVVLQKSSGRESHLVVTLTEGKNREIRRLCEAIGHPVTRLKRVAFGALTLGDLAPGEWRELSDKEVRLKPDTTSDVVSAFRRTRPRRV
ncbi:MAG TPA: pseudouridine synthase [Vicinamibacterales bacterium]